MPPSPEPTRQTPATAWRRAWPLAAHRGRVLLLAGVSFLGGAVEAVALVLVARLALALADGAETITLGPSDSLQVDVGPLLVLALVLPFVRFGFGCLATWLSAGLTTGAMAELRKRLFRTYLHASWATQSEQRLGELQELLTTSAYQVLLALRSVAVGVEAGLVLGALLMAALVVDPVGSLVVGAAVALLTLVLHPLRVRVQRTSRAAAGSSRAFATTLTERSTLAREIRVFGVEERVAAEVDQSIDHHRRSLARTLFADQVAPAGYQSLALVLILLALLAVHLSGADDFAALAAVVLIMLRSLSYGQTVQSCLQTLQQGAPHLEAIEERLAAFEVDAPDRAGAPVAPIESLAFDAVSFGYEPDRPVFQEVTFEAGRGELIGIAGPSGSGKSTLVQLVLRLREPSRGHVRADGRDIRELSLDGWYERVGFAPQEPALLTGTVLDNIAFYRPIDRAAVERAATLAQIHDEILTWPDGYDTWVGERGTNLSGGQRQRICLARALVGDPDILVFDEPTSALDGRSETLLRASLEARSANALVFVIAHRMSTLRSCDRIMILRDGGIEAFDDPQLLPSSSAFFREVVDLSAEPDPTP